MTRACTQMRQHAPQRFFVHLTGIGPGNADLERDQSGEPFGELARGQDKVRRAGSNRAARHRGIFGLVGILHQNNAAGFLDGARAKRAVRTGTAENDGEPVAQLLSQRTEQKIDRQSPAARLVEMQRLDLVIDYLQSAVRRNDIDLVGLQSLTFA